MILRVALQKEDLVWQATHAGWQLISAEHPLKMSGMGLLPHKWVASSEETGPPGNSFFEVRILKNPDPPHAQTFMVHACLELISYGRA